MNIFEIILFIGFVVFGIYAVFVFMKRDKEEYEVRMELRKKEIERVIFEVKFYAEACESLKELRKGINR